MSHNVEHGNLSETDGLHEPKGVAAATSGDVYVADGAASGAFSALEGTEIASTGEAGGTKFLQEDGDNTCSWQGVDVATDVTGMGTGVGAFLATPSSANLITAVTDETGSGALAFATSPTLVTPVLGTPSSGTLTSCTGLPGDTGTTSTGEDKGRILVADGANAVGWQELVWKDMIGIITVRGTGPTAPSLTAYQGGNVDQFAFSSGDEVMLEFHMPHDYAPGTDIYIHAHWSHNGTAISGNCTWEYTHMYAKGHHQQIFPAEKVVSTTTATTDITTTPRYEHFIDEVQLSAATPGGTQIDSDDLEPDGLILVRVSLTALPTITGGSPNEPFLHFVDIHYQSNYIGTANKVPNFYA